ncbi:hypothetical protein C0J52_10093 [Blattella germanica]|nr:hypothetical protein C0J52_10093 [Blattella germanica]
MERINLSLSSKTPKQLHAMYICSLHFSKAKYVSPVSNRLVHDAEFDINLLFYSVSEISTPSDSRIASSPVCNLSSLFESSPAVNISRTCFSSCSSFVCFRAVFCSL